MKYVVEDNNLKIRIMRDCLEDYSLITKWLSNPVVSDYYEGKTKLYNLEKVIAKFSPYAKGEERVIPCIIEYDNESIGYVQYYKTETEEYDESLILDMSKYKNSYGLDIFIGETQYWNKGIGTKVIKNMIDKLFKKEKADIIFIDPQTWNKRAVRCYEKCGFSTLILAKNRETHDDELMDCYIMVMTPPDKALHTI